MKTEDQLNENSIVVKGLDPGQVRLKDHDKHVGKTLGGGISKITKIMTNTINNDKDKLSFGIKHECLLSGVFLPSGRRRRRVSNPKQSPGDQLQPPTISVLAKNSSMFRA